ncbi:uncharacterized protein BXZ73DRAFT_90023 [Epithele typhae]|uniref:uncharacterized protein n=1 Tax=Epithele typhae TaxID=378194 RepID=UPI002007C36A|nr:uncharacterized protein BXZ73DRAFT_90023 [Epithele typhae]KAH9932091.1 hypothetical protein BXZ73DRAFT_90023 [Epithele typhae]
MEAVTLFVPVTSDKPSLADLLTIEPSASIFYSYARELELSAILADKAARNTLLVPINKAVIALPHKPHEDPKPQDDTVILTEAEFDNMSKKNVERWISAHIIPRSPIDFASSDPTTFATLLADKNVTFTHVADRIHADVPGWARVILDGSVRLIGKKEASNGVMYMLDGTVKVD